MKLFIYLSVLVVAMSCGNAKEPANISGDISGVSNTQERIVGVVKKEKEGCVLIHVSVDGKNTIIYPDNLDERFQADNMRIKFFYHHTAVPAPGDCPADTRGTLEEVTPLR